MLGGDYGFHFRASIMFPEDAAVECPKEPPQVASPRCLPRKLPKQDGPYKTLPDPAYRHRLLKIPKRY